ncbi:MAG: cupin protein [Deferribacteraceae bacterium]|jgi:quercetin dioxygenase-like cupin family protein|nr:cupin protein [Deferribacteraceae bacterium]
MKRRVFIKSGSGEFVQMLPGVKRKTLTFAEKTLSIEIFLDKGSKVPPHSHIYEQTGYMIYGKAVLNIGGETYNVEPGDAWTIPSDVEHSLEVIEDSKIIEIFSPMREEYI